MMDTIVVIPCYNEARRLDLPRFASFALSQSDQQLFFVNDGSTDETGALIGRINELSAGKVLYQALPRNLGKAEAVRLGMLAAMERSPKIVGFWDADLAAPLEEIATLRQVLEQHPHIQVVMGSRVALLGRNIERAFGRHLCGRVFATAASVVLQLPVYDTQCGAKLFRVSAEMQTLLQQPFLSRWIFDVEILARLGFIFGKNDVVYEQPLQRWRDVAGSKLRPRHFLKAAQELLAIWKKYRCQRGYPGHLLAVASNPSQDRGQRTAA